MTDIRGLLECLVRALANQHLWREGTDLRAWLFTILHNLFVSEIRCLAREQKRLAMLDMKPAVMPGSDPELSYRVREVLLLPTLPSRTVE